MNPCKDFPEYSVTHDGKVFSHRSNLWLRPENINGYLRVVLHVRGISNKRLVHRLVAEAFLPPIDGKPYVNHIDSNKQNNNVENLEWCTAKENTQHMMKSGRWTHSGYKTPYKDHCRKGHKRTEENTLVLGRKRWCKICRKIYRRKYYLANK